MIIAGTGHRPQKLGNEFDMKGPYSEYIISQLQKIFDQYKPDNVISGLAIGFDQILALVALDNNINLTAAIPFKGQETKWPQSSQDIYNEILAHPLTTVVIIDDKLDITNPTTTFWQISNAMQKRNEWMVDQLIDIEDQLVRVWDGSKGGTYNCIKYAKKTIGENRIIPIDIKHLSI
jgi:uncharacterized phage-like protein YoqJ